MQGNSGNASAIALAPASLLVSEIPTKNSRPEEKIFGYETKKYLVLNSNNIKPSIFIIRLNIVYKNYLWI